MKTLNRILAVIILLLAAATGYYAYLGYFGGAPVFVAMQPTGKAMPPRDRVVVALLSGDQGIKVGMAAKVAKRLTDAGIPVLGINSLAYFRKKRTPAEVRWLIGEAIRRAHALSGNRKLLLVGQSYGADMVHLGLDGLSEDLRRQVSMAVMVVPTDTVLLRASPAQTLELTPVDAMAVDSGRKLTWLPVLCVQGVEEKNSLCPMLTAPNVRKVALPGGHPMHRDDAAVFGQVMTAVDRVARMP